MHDLDLTELRQSIEKSREIEASFGYEGVDQLIELPHPQVIALIDRIEALEASLARVTAQRDDARDVALTRGRALARVTDDSMAERIAAEVSAIEGGNAVDFSAHGRNVLAVIRAVAADEGAARFLALSARFPVDPDVLARARAYRGEPLPLGHLFIGVAGHPDDDECTYRSDGTASTYCGEPETAHATDEQEREKCLHCRRPMDSEDGRYWIHAEGVYRGKARCDPDDSGLPYGYNAHPDIASGERVGCLGRGRAADEQEAKQ